MRAQVGLVIMVGFSLLVFSGIVASEPWISSRFAQNCASCHAPGRVNVEAKERRCTLSCQGCHTNPSGGGLRNFYGKWTQERWLNSGYIKGYKLNRSRPEVLANQFYTNERLEKYTKGGKNKELAKVEKEGFRLRETRAQLDESEYDRRSTQEKTVYPKSEALLRIPQDDPYRLRRENYFNAGLDLRYFYWDYEQKTTDADTEKLKGSFIMATDVAASVEPYHGVTAVVEGRFLNAPSGNASRTAWEEGFTNASTVRSAYILVDDLMYNSYFQYGLYRPMFGPSNPDHTSLFNAAMEGPNQSMRKTYKAFTFGTAPNVPFMNVHYLMPMADSGDTQDKGFVVNLGARFVTLGAYGVVSYWKTEAAGAAGGSTKRKMMSLTGGATFFKRWTVVGDYSMIERDRNLPGDVRSDKGGVITIENRYRFFKEYYLIGNYEMLNTTRQIYQGKTDQTTFGVGTFPISSLELQLLYRKMSETFAGADTANPSAGTDTKTDVKALIGQMHFYF